VVVAAAVAAVTAVAEAAAAVAVDATKAPLATSIKQPGTFCSKRAERPLSLFCVRPTATIPSHDETVDEPRPVREGDLVRERPAEATAAD
jgi:hypothetical protein